MFIRFTQNVLMPAWILGVGLGLLIAPPFDVAGSLSLLVVGIFIVPALVLIPCRARGMGPLPPSAMPQDDQR
jgi:hypothetical protein